MKRLISLLLFLLLCCAVQASARMNAYIAGSVASSSGTTYTDCSNIGTASFYWNGDYTSQETYGCKDASTTVTGTLNGADIDTYTNYSISESPDSGDNVVQVNAAADYMSFTPTGLVDLTGAEGRFEADIYCGNLTNKNTVFYLYNAGTNSLKLLVNSSNYLEIEHVGNSVAVTMIGTDAISENTWTHIQFRWSVSNDGPGSGTGQVGVKVGDNAWQVSTDNDSLTAFTGNATLFRTPAAAGTDDTFYLDNIKIYTTSGL